MPSRWSQRRERFRAVLAGERCVHPGSVFDPVSARIAEDLGFEIGMFAGSVASMTVLGAPDLIVLTLSEFADQAYRINRAGNLPLMVDADHGYGNALNVMRTVEELENAGVAGMSIEDTELPRPYGRQEKARLLSIDEGVGKMRAALAARRDNALVIAGRTTVGAAADFSAAADFNEFIDRVNAYAATGVDAIFVVGIKTREQIETLAASASLPIIFGNVPAEFMDLDYLSAQGAKICLQGHQPFAAAVQAVHNTLKALREGAKPADLQAVASADLLKRVTRDADYQRWTDDFLGAK